MGTHDGHRQRMRQTEDAGEDRFRRHPFSTRPRGAGISPVPLRAQAQHQRDRAQADGEIRHVFRGVQRGCGGSGSGVGYDGERGALFLGAAGGPPPLCGERGEEEASALTRRTGSSVSTSWQRARETASGSRPATRWSSRCRARQCRWCLRTIIRAAIPARLSRTTTSPAPSPRLSAECRSRLPTTSSIRTRKAILLRKTGCSEERLKRSFEWKRR